MWLIITALLNRLIFNIERLKHLCILIETLFGDIRRNSATLQIAVDLICRRAKFELEHVLVRAHILFPVPEGACPRNLVIGGHQVGFQHKAIIAKNLFTAGLIIISPTLYFLKNF